jgi:photosystem II stability/assembly factor-like uncharacterized protein
MLSLVAFSGLATRTLAQNVDPKLYQSLAWRCIGPFRGGRCVGAVGVPSQPNLFYIGVNNGGVWKTDDYGRTWKSLFDQQPTGSIGDVAVCESHPQVIYAGSGEGLQRPDLSVGDGIYKSTDSGKTWANVGLRDAQQIGSIIVDPKDPDRVFVAALGHPYGPNPQRGVFRSTDGGKTWQKVLYRNENVGAVQVAFDPHDSRVVYAVLWESRQGPWENGEWQGPGNGLFKSTDGGANWTQLIRGLPGAQDHLGRIGLGISTSNPKIIYATVDAGGSSGIYRSDDAGENWRLVNDTDGRLYGRGSDFAEIKPDPTNPEVVYIANTCTYKSTDGGKTFIAFKGAPGGDDYHRIWINPANPKIILLASDQGATISVNGGETWSSWYNQPTAQFYHVITDNQFPYWVYGGQQESGSAGVASRGDYGAITWRDWRTVGIDEYDYVAPDPLDSNLIYGGKVRRFDKRTGQVQDIGPEPGSYRALRTAPVVFSPVDKKTLYFAGNVLFKTTDGGHAWQKISPDLSRQNPDVPESIGVYRTPQMASMPRRGVIYTVAPSFQDVSTIWAGTDDGLIHITRDGGRRWSDVTPPQLTAWSKVSILEASHVDNDSAYAAINRLRLDDTQPHIYRTHDGGKTWAQIVEGIPDGNVVNSLREDPTRKGLLYAGTERSVFFSLDDGDHWQSLRLNLPATSVRDLVVHGDDLVIGTHGRSFWILDDLTPLRQIDQGMSSSDAFLFRPQAAYRIRRSVNTDTPIPPEEPMGLNPPDGAIIDYWLKTPASQVTLEILDSTGALVRKYSSSDPPERVNPGQYPYPSYWFRPQKSLATVAGMQRWVWDLHYPPLEGPRTFAISAIYHDTPTSPLGPSALPGEYSIRLTVDGRSFTQPLTLRMDPRVVTPADGIARMFEISHGSHEIVTKARAAQASIRNLRSLLAEIRPRANQSPAAGAIAAFDAKAATLSGPTAGGGRRGRGATRPTTQPSFGSVANAAAALMSEVESADAAPTEDASQRFERASKQLNDLLTQWGQMQEKDLPALNEKLKSAGLPALAAPGAQ